MRTAQFPRSLTVSISESHYEVLKGLSDAKEISIASLTREIVAGWIVSNNSNDSATNKKEIYHDK